MNKFFSFSLFVVSFILFGNCSEKELTPGDLATFISDDDNGLRKTEAINGLSLDVTYRPTDLIIDSQFSNRALSQSVLDTLRQHYDGYYYFILSLSTHDNEEVLRPNQFSFNQYSELLQRMSFRMHEYVTLVTSTGDSIPLSDYILENTYGLGSANTMLFVFGKEDISPDATWVQINLNEFGLGTGHIRFRFSLEDISNCPSIDFSSKISLVK